jgi:hypothetical protein
LKTRTVKAYDFVIGRYVCVGRWEFFGPAPLGLHDAEGQLLYLGHLPLTG